MVYKAHIIEAESAGVETMRGGYSVTCCGRLHRAVHYHVLSDGGDDWYYTLEEAEAEYDRLRAAEYVNLRLYRKVWDNCKHGSELIASERFRAQGSWPK